MLPVLMNGSNRGVEMSGITFYLNSNKLLKPVIRKTS